MKKYGILFLLMVLASCGSDDKPEVTKDDHANKTTKPEISTDNLICPQVAIIREVQENLDYGGEKAEPSELVAKARLDSISGDCAYRLGDDDGVGSGIDITFTLHEVAARGPRLGGKQVSFPYFIAVVDPVENILNRQIVTAKFEFSGSNKVAETDEDLHVFIPLSKAGLQAGPDYRVLVGFKMPKEKN